MADRPGTPNRQWIGGMVLGVILVLAVGLWLAPPDVSAPPILPAAPHATTAPTDAHGHHPPPDLARWFDPEPVIVPVGMADRTTYEAAVSAAELLRHAGRTCDTIGYFDLNRDGVDIACNGSRYRYALVRDGDLWRIVGK